VHLPGTVAQHHPNNRVRTGDPPFCYKRGMATFTITLRTREDGGGIRTLRAALKLLLRRFGLRALKVEQTPEHD